MSEHGLQETIEAVNITHENGKSSIRYAEGILKNKRGENETIRRNGSNRKTETVDWQAEYEECTVKDDFEFYTPIYDRPVIIQNNINNTYHLAGIPKRYYDMSFTWLKETAAFQRKTKRPIA